MAIDFKKKIQDDMLIEVSRMKPVIKPTKPHKHAGYHELIFLFKGSGMHTIDDQKFEVKPYTGFYLKPGQVHCWDFSQIPEGFVILFKEEVMATYTETMNNLFSMSVQFNLPEQTGLFTLLEQFYDDFKAWRDNKILQAYLNLTLLKTLALADKNTSVEPSIIADFYAFKKLVNDHFIELRQASQYAEQMNLSVKRLNAICRSAAQSSAIDIIKERILIEAKNLITHTTLTVSEIAFRLNFSDVSNFVKFFRSLTALTPMEYRAGTR